MVKRGVKKNKFADMLIPVPPKCICGANDWWIYPDGDREKAVCKKCGYQRYYYGSGDWTGTYDR